MSRNKSKEQVMVKFSFALLPEEKLKTKQYAKAINISPLSRLERRYEISSTT